MCHEIALASRLDRGPYTVPLAELLLTKLQIVELTARDQGDLYTLCYHHPVVDHPSAAGIEATVIAHACGADWGLWRTCTQSIERRLADVARHDLPSEAVEVHHRLQQLRERIEAQPKSGARRRRSRLGDRKRRYREPEEP